VGALVRVGLNAALFGLLYFAAIILLHRGCGPLRHFAGLLREMRLPRGRVEAASPAR
jgi:hypothetical protein